MAFRREQAQEQNGSWALENQGETHTGAKERMPAGPKTLRNCERKAMTILKQNRQIPRDSVGLRSKTVIEFRSAEIGVKEIWATVFAVTAICATV